MPSPKPNIWSKETFETLLSNADSEGVQADIEKFKRLRDELEESSGARFYDLMNDVARTKEMHQENYLDLLHVIARFERGPTDALHSEEEIFEDLYEFTREFHNYLAMCHSLRDHTYRLKGKLERDGFNENYQAMLRETGLTNTAPFINGLRDYVSHRRVPVTTGSRETNFGGEPFVDQTSEILIKKPQLLEWDNWESNAREILEDLESPINIREILIEHQKRTNEFYTWLFDELNSAYEQESLERDELILELAQLQEQYFEGVNAEFLAEEA